MRSPELQQGGLQISMVVMSVKAKAAQPSAFIHVSNSLAASGLGGVRLKAFEVAYALLL